MDKLQALMIRKKLAVAANLQSEQAVAVAGSPGTSAGVTPAAASFDRLKFKEQQATTQLGMTLREIPYADEISRITNMPIVNPMDKMEFEEFCRQTMLVEAYEAGKRYFEVQADGISAYSLYNGAFCPVAVGFGKTLMSLACASIAYREKGLKKILLLVPPQVIDQLCTTDIKWARSMIPMGVPIHIVGGRTQKDRRALCMRGSKGLYIMPYSYLSVVDTTDMIFNIAPELIICDEAHYLANRTSARTKRLMDYVDKKRPQAVILSGTITSKSIRDYFHLIKWALGEYNPLPNSIMLAEEWGSVIDAEATGTYGDESEERKGASGPLLPLIKWAQKNFLDEEWRENIPGFRKAYKKRMSTAPGVVSSGDAEIGTSLIIQNNPIQDPEKSPGWKQLEEFKKKLDLEWLTPNGDEIEHAIHKWKWMYELSAGFYNELTWPTPERYAERKRIGVTEAESILKRAKEYHEAGQRYGKKLRDWLSNNHKPKLDTPFLVAGDMARHGAKNVGTELYEKWAAHKAADFEGRPDRDSTAVRVCPYKIDACVEWVKELPKGRGALIWVYHQAVGQWVFEALKAAGIECVHCPAGDEYNKRILLPDTSAYPVVASITAHGTGKNLQAFQENYFLQWPRQATTAEQALGRTHRNGQKADELVMNTNLTNTFDELNFAACLNDSLYIHQTTGNRQKLIYTSYNFPGGPNAPMPTIFPSAVLRERGDKHVRMLSKEQQDALNERFQK